MIDMPLPLIYSHKQIKTLTQSSYHNADKLIFHCIIIMLQLENNVHNSPNNILNCEDNY